MKESFLHKKLEERKAEQAYRTLRLPDGKADFCSNDYLGIIHQGLIEANTTAAATPLLHGSGGSRLLAGNYSRIEQLEKMLATFHEAPAGLAFNSGYDANLGLLSCVPQRGDTVLYDTLSHASLRDGLRLSFAQAFAFEHNDLHALEKRLQAATGNIFVVTESVFSMDGDQAPLEAMVRLCKQYEANLIVDEAHATGVIGEQGEGLVQHLGLQQACFARIHTFGKAVGCHGAVILGSETLRQFLINFSRPFIYTTALPESSVAAIQTAYGLFPAMHSARKQLQQLVQLFQQASLPFEKLRSDTPIQVVIIPGNDQVKAIAGRLQAAHLDVRPILYPTVPKGSERLRIVLHAFNTVDEVNQLIHLLTASASPAH
ncbi:8-amino-7-oxononanoate synthase [Paraflavitalea sp. CAU 1676]|uniref:aminotransferase class I/II-fold pyridoxal phosphate-dependent enzyme n=1 Tax=Paraflavitalea sp. CAU 1676 TaxID=3032598 RepID=UPI0023DC6E11|nr:8-amino-7-oxononanoate synthase [Paraflavitalea sp. CAU 1676]MDF2188865.1 8-amino-7-oxononanoate synthase [Paraflavitalea sp. CAU 1676]